MLPGLNYHRWFHAESNYGRDPLLLSPLQIFAAHIQASEELRGSSVFGTALLVILASGNYLNYGNRSGSAAAFRLTTLQKVHDTRSSDGKTTILQAGTGRLYLPDFNVERRHLLALFT